MNHNLNEDKPYIGLTEHNYQQLDYSDGDLVIINHLTYTPRMHATQSDKVFIAFCKAGIFSFEMDGTEYLLEQNDVFIGYPNAIYNRFEMSSDLDCHLICISKSLLLELLYPNQSIWNKTLYLRRHNILQLTTLNKNCLDHLHALLMTNLKREQPMFQKEMVHTIIQAVIYELCQTLSKDATEEYSQETNQKKILFDRFISLLSKNEVKKHPLSYYADILCVSPRYLTMVCRNVSGKTAYDWIREYVQNDVRYYLLHTNLSIKETAIRLGFCNLSFFGKYVRENFGKSPSDFRHDNKEK
jgi:AraC-like DNA-binding protein